MTKTTTIAALAALLMSTSALATSPKPPQQSGNAAIAASSAAAVSVSGAAALAGGGAGGSSSASVSTHEQRQSPAVAAPSLAASSEACMGSASAGVSVAGFGIAGGGTFTNDECQRRLNSQQLRLLGHSDAALAILCTNVGVADALAAVGKACPAQGRARADAPQQLTPVAASSFCKTWPADPYCRAGQ